MCLLHVFQSYERVPQPADVTETFLLHNSFYDTEKYDYFLADNNYYFK